MKRFIVCILVAVSFLFSCAPVLATVNGWVAVKTALYEQTADHVQPTQAYGWNFYIHVEGDAISIKLTGPGLGSGLNMTQVEAGDWELSVDFTSKAQLDAAFPAGTTFTLTASGGTGGTKVQNFMIPSDGYPAIPYLTGTVFSGFQSLNVYQDYPMSWNSYSGGSEILTIFPAAGGFWVVEEDVDDAYDLSAGALDDNSDYIGNLEFFAVSPLPSSDFGGGAFRFISLTTYEIHTVTPKVVLDDFSDNSRNTGLWDVFRVSAEREWVEQNGRLEAISTAGVYERDSGVWEWTGPKPAFDENWTVMFDATINVTGTVPGSSTWIGFLAADSTLSNTATVEQWVQDGERGVDAAAKVNEADLWEVNELISSNTVTLRMNYDSGKKELHASYDDGSGYWNFLASRSVTNWGMTDADDFRILIFGGSEADGLVSGDAYGDNFTFEINDIESDPEVVIPCQSIVGSWYMKNKEVPSHDNVVLTFLTNGIYFMCQDGDSVFDDHGVDGMEKGNYTWDFTTGDFSITNVQQDTNDEWGLSGWQENAFNLMLVTNNTLYMRPEGEGPYLLHRVVAQTSPASIVGAWLIDGVAAVTFLDNGIYYLAHAHIPGGGGQAGMERGIYDWDPITGEFNPMPIVDTNGEWGLSHGHENDTVRIEGNTLYLSVEGEGIYTGYRVVAPECSDLDSDGLPDIVEMQLYGNPTNGLTDANSDGDGLTDREEFIAGTSPDDENSVFAVSNAPPSPAGHVLTWNAIPGRVYTVVWTDDLSNGFQTLEADIPYPQNSYTDTVHSAEDGGYYNLKVELAN